jgi:hypothetical protein
MSSNKELGSLTLGSAHEKFDVWPRPEIRNKMSNEIQISCIYWRSIFQMLYMDDIVLVALTKFFPSNSFAMKLPNAGFPGWFFTKTSERIYTKHRKEPCESVICTLRKSMSLKFVNSYSLLKWISQYFLLVFDKNLLL